MEGNMAVVQPFTVVIRDDPDQKQVPVLVVESTEAHTFFLLASTYGWNEKEKKSYISSWHWVKDTEVAHLWAGPPIQGSLARQEETT